MSSQVSQAIHITPLAFRSTGSIIWLNTSTKSSDLTFVAYSHTLCCKSDLSLLWNGTCQSLAFQLEQWPKPLYFACDSQMAFARLDSNNLSSVDPNPRPCVSKAWFYPYWDEQWANKTVLLWVVSFSPANTSSFHVWTETKGTTARHCAIIIHSSGRAHLPVWL